MTQHPPVDPPDTIELLAQLIAVDTRNPGGDEAQGLAVLAELFGRFGLDVTVQDYRPGNANLVATATFGTGTGPTILLNSHIDVVPTGSGWTTDPFAPSLRGGDLYGRGAADAKGSLAAMASAVLELVTDPGSLDGTVVYSAVGDEEVGSTGARALVGQLAVDACIVGEPTDLRLMTAHKGSVRPVIEVRGIAAHAATPHEGTSAIGGAVGVLEVMAELADRLAERAHPLVGAPTLTPVLISGGEAPNAVPERCRITVDRRLVPGETADEAMAEIAAELTAFSARNTPLEAVIVDAVPSTGGPSETPADDPFVLAASRAMASIGERSDLAGLVVNCDMTTFRAAGIPTLVLGPGTLAVMHTKDEHVAVDDVHRARRAYAAVLRELLAPTTTPVTTTTTTTTSEESR